MVKQELNYEEYVCQLNINWGSDLVDRALDYLKQRVGFTTAREQARYLAHVFEYDADDKGNGQVYNIHVRAARKYVGLPLTPDDW